MTKLVNFLTLDVFTSKAYEGNPLGVVFLPPPSDFQLTQRQKQTIAHEFNLSETIFVHEKTGTGETRTVDIFTTSEELPFAGHPTIGAASWFLHHAPENVRSLLLKAGEFPIALEDPNNGGGIVTARVAHNVHIHKNQYPLNEVSRLYPSLEPYLAASGITLFSIVKGMSQLLVELPSLEALAAVTTAAQRPNASYLDQGWEEGLITTYFYVRGVKDEKLGKEVIRTRTILGNEEDPATGSAASGLTAYLSLTEGRTGEFKYDIVQGVEMGRRSEIGVDIVVKEAGKIESLVLKGSAVKVTEGKIVVPEDS
ncbi:PhzF family phenazine biosynthesis protein [Aspergillus lucknowensis]|uniref:Phenazine biosynthesis-like protein n=1 Tax=Aspergillus lucknowensis TaxID=176173 RepID=A0ABR4LQN2_9EURO